MAVKARDQVTVAVAVDVASVDVYYKLQPSTSTAPSKPTTANPDGWTTIEPTYDEESTNTLYTCQKTTLTDGTFYWSAVSKSTAYEASKTAWNLAHNTSQELANLSVGGANLIVFNKTMLGRLDADGNVYASSDGNYHMHTEPISVDGGAPYVLSWFYKVTEYTNSFLYVSWLDIDGEHISRTNVEKITNVEPSYRKFISPENAAYAVVNIPTHLANKCMAKFEKGSVPSDMSLSVYDATNQPNMLRGTNQPDVLRNFGSDWVLWNDGLWRVQSGDANNGDAEIFEVNDCEDVRQRYGFRVWSTSTGNKDIGQGKVPYKAGTYYRLGGFVRLTDTSPEQQTSATLQFRIYGSSAIKTHTLKVESNEWTRFNYSFALNEDQAAISHTTLFGVRGKGSLDFCGLYIHEGYAYRRMSLGEEYIPWQPATEDYAQYGLTESRFSQIDTDFQTLDEAISAKVSQTDVYKMIQPNLAPYFSIAKTDVYDVADNPNGYWKRIANNSQFTTYEMQLEHNGSGGWAHFAGSVSSGSPYVRFEPIPIESLKPSTEYTFMVEADIINAASTLTGMTLNICEGDLNTDAIDPFDERTRVYLLNSEGASCCTVSTRASLSDVTVLSRSYLQLSGTGAFDIYLRISLYEGNYNGPFKPYVDPSLSSRVSHAESTLSVHATDIQARVEKDGVIAAINASVEESGGSAVKIQADKVEITGAAVFKAVNGREGTTKIDGGKVDVSSITIGDLSDGDDYATKQDAQDYVNAVKVGGRNLLWKTEDIFSSWYNNACSVTEGQIDPFGGNNAVLITPTTSTHYYIYRWTRLNMPKHPADGYGGIDFTFSIWLKAANSNATVGLSMRSNNSAKHMKTVELTDSWSCYELTGSIIDDITNNDVVWVGQEGTDPYYVAYPKLECGTKSTDWTPAPEDVNSSISDVQANINSSRTWYANCESAAGEAKEATITPATTDFVLSTGTVVYVKFATTNSLAVASLTLDVNDTGAKPIKRYGTTNMAAVGNITAGMVCQFVYDGTNWLWVGHVDTNTTYNLGANQHSSAIKAKIAITRYFLICGDDDGYRNVAAGAAFDLSYPVLYAYGGGIAVNKTATNTYETYPGANFGATGTITSGGANKMLYLKGTVSGNIFTVASSAFLTTVPPISEDGYAYMPLGIMTSATAGYFQSSKDLYAYKDGAFGPVSIREASAAAKTATNYIQADSTGIRIANANPATATTYQHQTATETEFVVGGTSMAEFGGSGARIGDSSAGHIAIDADSVDIADDDYVITSFSGTHTYTESGSELQYVQEKSESTITTGKPDDAYISLDSTITWNGDAVFEEIHSVTISAGASSVIQGVTNPAAIQLGGLRSNIHVVAPSISFIDSTSNNGDPPSIIDMKTIISSLLGGYELFSSSTAYTSNITGLSDLDEYKRLLIEYMDTAERRGSVTVDRPSSGTFVGIQFGCNTLGGNIASGLVMRVKTYTISDESTISVLTDSYSRPNYGRLSITPAKVITWTEANEIGIVKVLGFY